MKKLIIILFLFVTPVCAFDTSDYNINIMGIDAKKITKQNIGYMILGAVSSILIHEAGHAIYLKSIDKNYELRATSVTHNESLSNNEERGLGRSGFVSQLLVGTILTSFKKTRVLPFTAGLVAMNDITIWSYPIRKRNNTESSDLQTIRNGNGNGAQEWFVYSGISFYNTNTITQNVKSMHQNVK